MASPTEADHQKAREIAHQDYDYCHADAGTHSAVCDDLTHRIALALAEARNHDGTACADYVRAEYARGRRECGCEKCLEFLRER